DDDAAGSPASSDCAQDRKPRKADADEGRHQGRDARQALPQPPPAAQTKVLASRCEGSHKPARLQDPDVLWDDAEVPPAHSLEDAKGGVFDVQGQTDLHRL